jgi:DNA polymerase theta
VAKTITRALVVLPYRALVEEKAKFLTSLLRHYNAEQALCTGRNEQMKWTGPLKVQAQTGDRKGGLKDARIIVATIEKASNIVTKMMEKGRIHELRVVTVDEVHMIDSDRGALVEKMLTMLKFLRLQDVGKETSTTSASTVLAHGQHTTSTIWHPNVDTQVVCMSATIPNLDEIGGWLHGKVYVSQYRPVALSEYICMSRNRTLELVKHTPGSNCIVPSGKDADQPPQMRLLGAPTREDPDNFVRLCAECVRGGAQVLAFTMSKARAESMAGLLTRVLPKRLLELDAEAHDAKMQENKQALELQTVNASKTHMRTQLAVHLTTLHAPAKLCDAVSAGIAWHHASLSDEVRREIENAYLAGTVAVLSATSTLAAGVNLPARRVIFRDPFTFDGSFLLTKDYKQMAGRAGRAGKEAFGESIMMYADAKHRDRVLSLVQSDIPRSVSRLLSGRSSPNSKAETTAVDRLMSGQDDGLCRLVLDAISSGLATTRVALRRLAGCTLWEEQHAKYGEPGGMNVPCVRERLDEVLDFLVHERLVAPKHAGVAKLSAAATALNEGLDLDTRNEDSIPLDTTPLGRGASISGLGPAEALRVYEDLARARKCFVVADYLHALFVIAPSFQNSFLAIDWACAINIYNRLTDVQRRIADLVSIRVDALQYMKNNRISSLSDIVNKRLDGVLFSREDAITLSRFFAAYALRRLAIGDCTVDRLADILQCRSGDLQLLQKTARSFSGQCVAFAKELHWGSVETILKEAFKLVSARLPPRLADLMKIKSMTRQAAEALASAKIRSAEDILRCDTTRLVDIFSLRAAFNPLRSAAEIPDYTSFADMLLRDARDCAASLSDTGEEETAHLDGVRTPSVS